MSSVTKTGIIVGFSDHAVHDYMVNKPVLDVYLNNGNTTRFILPDGFSIDYALVMPQLGSEILRICPDAKFTHGYVEQYAQYNNRDIYYDLRVLPSIGDTVSISWDYERCSAKIDVFANERVPINWDYPVSGERTFHIGDILNSLYPDKSDKR